MEDQLMIRILGFLHCIENCYMKVSNCPKLKDLRGPRTPTSYFVKRTRLSLNLDFEHPDYLQWHQYCNLDLVQQNLQITLQMNKLTFTINKCFQPWYLSAFPHNFLAFVSSLSLVSLLSLTLSMTIFLTTPPCCRIFYHSLSFKKVWQLKL